MAIIADSYKAMEQTDGEDVCSETNFIENEDKLGRICDGEFGKQSGLKRGRIPRNSARRYLALLALAERSFLGDAYKKFLDVLKTHDQDSRVGFQVLSDSKQHEHLNNAGRAPKIESRYPRNRREYISI